MMEFRDQKWVVRPAVPGSGLSERAPAFLPDWEPNERGPGRALMAIAERYASILEEKLARAPDKARLKFLELLGVRPIPAQSARTPIVFEIPPGNGHSRAPERTQLSAQPTDAGEPVVFETESAIALADSHLAEVKTILPFGRYAEPSLECVF